MTSYLVSVPLRFAATQTANATLAKGYYTPVNATSSSITMTLPTGAGEGVVIVVEKTDSSSNPVVVSGNLRRQPSQTYNLGTLNEVVTFTADAVGSWWPSSHHISSTGLTQLIVANEANLAVTSTTTAGASYTLNFDDASNVVETTATSPITIVVPTNTSVTFPVGTTIEIDQIGTGQVTLAGASGVTLTSRNNSLRLAGQYAVARLRKRSANTWIVSGDLDMSSAVRTWPTGSEPSLTGVADGTLWIEYTP